MSIKPHTNTTKEIKWLPSYAVNNLKPRGQLINGGVRLHIQTFATTRAQLTTLSNSPWITLQSKTLNVNVRDSSQYRII